MRGIFHVDNEKRKLSLTLPGRCTGREAVNEVV